jgi:adenylate cyclase
MDRAAFEAAGLYDPLAPNAAERLQLLEWLASDGVTIDQMLSAVRDGSLVGVAGDLALRPLPHLTLAELAVRVDLPAEQIRELSLAAGLLPGSPSQPVFTNADAEALRAFIAGAALFGAAPVRRFARTVGAALAQIAEAAVALYLSTEGPVLASRASELVLAQQNLRAIRSLDGVQLALQGLFRAHMATAIRRQRLARRQQSIDTLHLTVGFVDLVGFTTLSRQMTSTELAAVIDRFEESAHDIVTARDGRLVKLIGDEVMFVSVDPRAACDTALALLERFVDDANVAPRGALAFGALLFRGGDYYGPIVNLASRLADLAVPHEILVTPEVAAQVADPALRFEPAGKRMLKGFEAPATVLTVGRAPGSTGVPAGGGP